MATTHTPEPWEYDRRYGKVVAANGRAVAGVAERVADPDLDLSVAEVNQIGHLLAAAPDMLEALKALLIATHHEECEGPRVRAACELAEAAVAKARATR